MSKTTKKIAPLKTVVKPKKRRIGIRLTAILITVLVLMLLAVSSLVMLAQYSDNIKNEASIVGLRKTNDAADLFRPVLNAFENKSSLLGRSITGQSYADYEDFLSSLQRIGADERFSDVSFIRFFKDDKEYTAFGEEFSLEMESKAILDIREHRLLACAGVVADRQFSVAQVAYCVPLDHFEYADMVTVFYPVSSVVNYSRELKELNVSDSRITAICSSEGEIVSILGENDLGLSLHNNMYASLRGIINNKNVIDSIQIRVANGSSGSYSVTISGNDHVVAVCSVSEYGAAPFSIIGVYRSSIINDLGYSTIILVIGELIFFFLLLFFIIIYLVTDHYKTEKKINRLHNTDDLLNLPTRSRFERDSYDILSRNKATHFAVIVIDIKHYSYLEEQLGKDARDKLLLYLKMLFSRVPGLDEAIGYLGKGRFCLLLHYRDVASISSRLMPVITLASSYRGTQSGKFTVELLGGIYKTESGITDSVSKMIELAVEAENANRFPFDFSSFRYYNELFHTSDAQNDYIELHMESALENKDFKIFYQPKYSISGDCPDGSEALVRWYNPELNNYMQPGVFLPLFEANRFIVKLDKYVYAQVCSQIEEARQTGSSFYPVSINISHITLAEKDIVSYFTSVKRKHNISDGFITIEMTESFAYEDLDMIRSIIADLHKNGFKCCIDDFGSGNSSYRILKEIPMDEAKLDHLFLTSGLAADRDSKVLASAISLAKSLNMKVTQKGVETLDQLEILKKLGCNSLQGYHYSKPLTLIDYLEFIETQRTMAKALNK